MELQHSSVGMACQHTDFPQSYAAIPLAIATSKYNDIIDITCKQPPSFNFFVA